MTARACGSSSPAALSGPGETAPWLPPRPAHARTRPERRARSCRAFLDRPGTTSSRRAGPLRSRTGVRSMMTVTYRSPRLVRRHTEGAPPARERSARGNRRPRGPPHHRSGEDRLTVWPERLSGSRCWRCARRSPGRLLPGRPTCTPGQGHAAPTRPPRGSAGSWAQPRWRCPVSTPGGSGCRRSAAGVPPAVWVSTPLVRGPGAGPVSHEPAPGRRRACRRGPRTRSACGTRSPRAWL